MNTCNPDVITMASTRASCSGSSAKLTNTSWQFPLHPRGDEAHVDAPQKADEAEEDDATVDGDEGEADDGGSRPDLVAGYDDGDSFLPGVSV